MQASEEEVKRQRLAKLAAWQQQQAAPATKPEVSVKAEPSNHSHAFQPFREASPEGPSWNQNPSQATW